MANIDKRHPNVVFVLTDDQGYWALGCNGNPDIITPNIDRLAEEGARFENFYCASPVCSPARASLLTGRIPSQHGVHDWIREGNTGSNAIEYLKGIRGYTEQLAEQGYQCAISGKWHLGDSEHPQKGFTRWYVHQRGGGNYFNAPMIRDGKLIEEPGYVTDAITDQALVYLEEMNREDAPFYLSVHYTAPHSPWTNGNHPQELLDLYKDCPFVSCPIREPHPWSVFSTAPDALTRENVLHPQESLQGYYAAVTGVDRGVGRIMEKLEELGTAENTLVIFTSDNGYNCGHHGIWGKGNGTFPMNMYDSSIRVPLILWHPGRIPEHTVVSDMYSAYDFAPTLLEYLEIPQEEDPTLPGRSFAGIFRGIPQAESETGMVVVFDEYGPVRMIRTPEDKYVCRYPYGPDEYYDLAADPEEEHNLIADPDRQERIHVLKQKMEAWFAKYVDPTRDGRGERVTGNGQLDMAGEHASKYQTYEPCGYAYHAEA